MTNTVIILLSGWSQSGKDAITEILQTYFGFRRYAFADPLKQMVCSLLKLPSNTFQSQEQKAKPLSFPSGITARDFLIQFAKWFLKTTGDRGYFARLIANSIRTSVNSSPPIQNKIVISDWRLPIEFETLTSELNQISSDIRFIKVRIRRLNQKESPVENHATEHELDDYCFDYILENPGNSAEDLTAAVMNMIKSLQIK